MTLDVKSPISRDKAEYEGCAAWSNPRGVSSNHVLSRAFGDAYIRRENVRHATFSFCASTRPALVEQTARDNELGLKMAISECYTENEVTFFVDRIKNLVSDIRPLLESMITHCCDFSAKNPCSPDIVALFLMAEKISLFNDDISRAIASYVKTNYKPAVRDIPRMAEDRVSSEKYLWTLYLERKYHDDSSHDDCRKRISDCLSAFEDSKNPGLSSMLWLFPDFATEERLKTVEDIVKETAPWWQRDKMLLWLACMGASECSQETVREIETQICGLQLETGAFATVGGSDENGDLVSSSIGLLVLISCAKKNNAEGPIMDALRKTVRWIIEYITAKQGTCGADIAWAYYALCEYVNLFKSARIVA